MPKHIFLKFYKICFERSVVKIVQMISNLEDIRKVYHNKNFQFFSCIETSIG